MANNKVMAPAISRLNFSFRLGKKSLSVVGVFVFTLVIVVLMMFRNQQVMEQQRLQDELTVVKNRLSVLGLDQLETQQASLNSDFEATNSQLGDIRARIAIPETSMQVSGRLFDIAAACGVEIVNLSAAESYPGKLNDIACTVLPASVSLRGEWLKLADYVYRLKTEYLTCFVEDAVLNVSASGETALSTANLNLLIYSYRGD